MSEKVKVELITIRRGENVYGAGVCVVTIGATPLDAVAVFAGRPTGNERHITTAEYAATWLTERGLDGDDALTLVNAAQGDKYAIKLLGEEEKP